MSALEVFCSYSHKDDDLRAELVTHLALLQRRGVIKLWHDRALVPGQDWREQISTFLRRADLILLLVSASFFESDFAYDVEMTEALARHAARQARVIPIIIRATDFDGAPFAAIQALPKDAKAVTSWENRDEAWVNVVKGIRGTISELEQFPLLPKSMPQTSVSDLSEDRKSSAQAMDKVHGYFSTSLQRSMASRNLPMPATKHLTELFDSLVDIAHQRKVLWVDDNPQNNASEIAVLRKLQIEIVTVTETEQALHTLQKGGFDLVISDWQRLPARVMGLSEGQRLLRLMRAQNVATPVVFYYGSYNHDAKQRALLADGARGATFRTDELFALISSILASS